MLLLAALVFATTPAELVLVEHYGDWAQVVPLVLCGLGLLAVAVLWRRPRRRAVLAARGIAAAVVAGTLYGVYEHVEANLGFELEVNVGSTVGDVFFDALGGVSPLLAPGILAFAALLVLIATYRHPALTRGTHAVGR